MRRPLPIQLSALVTSALVASTLVSCYGASQPPTANIQAGTQLTAARMGFRLDVRVPSHRRKRERRERFVSPATQSIAITLTSLRDSQAKSYNFNLDPDLNPDCTPSPTICHIFIALPAGRYNGAIATFDGPLDSHKNPTGSELSANQSFAFFIATGIQNAINVTLGGVPSSLVLIPTATSQLNGNTTSGFSLTRCSPGPQKVALYATDADGNLIVGGGSPSVSISSDNPSVLSVSTSNSLGLNGFVLSPPRTPHYASPNVTAHLTAVAQPTSNSGAGIVRQQVDVTYTSNVCGVFTEYQIPTPMSSPQGITVGPDGAMWFTENATNKVARIPLSATPSAPHITEFPIPTSNSHPYGIASGSDGALWFTECYPSQIGRLPLSGSPIFEFTTPTSDGAPQGIAAGPDGNIWFTESKGNKVGKIPTSGPITVTEFPVPTASSLPYAITTGPDNAMWFVESVGNKVARIPITATSGSPQISEYQAQTVNSFPRSITLGMDGALWFAEPGSDHIGKIVPGGSVIEFPIPSTGQPKGMATAADGNLWSVENSGDSLLQIPLTGSQMTEFPIPTPNAVFGDPAIVLAPDGSLWFTEVNADKIGRIQ